MMYSDLLATLPLDQQTLIHEAVARLEREFTGRFGRETIERFVTEIAGALIAVALIRYTYPTPRSR